MICPWIYENDKIILEYPPTHQGLLDWIIQKNIANLDEREQIVNSFPHKNRVNYVTRCMESTYSNKIEQIATSTFRRQSTDSKETHITICRIGSTAIRGIAVVCVCLSIHLASLKMVKVSKDRV